MSKLTKEIQESYLNLNKLYNSVSDDFNYLAENLNEEEKSDYKTVLLDVELTLDNKLYKTLSNGSLEDQIKEVKNQTNKTYIVKFYKYTNIISLIESEGLFEDLTDEDFEIIEKIHADTFEASTIEVLDSYGPKESIKIAKLKRKFSKAKNYKDYKNINDDRYATYHLVKLKDSLIESHIKKLNSFNSLLKDDDLIIVLDNLNNDYLSLKKLEEELVYKKNMLENKDIEEIDVNIEAYQDFQSLVHNIKS